MVGDVDKIALELATFVVQDLDWPGRPQELLGDRPVPLSQALDSAAMLELASILEDEYEIEIDDSEIVPDNFATVPLLAAMVARKRAEAVAAAV